MGNGAGKPLDEDTRDILSRTNNLLESTNGLLKKNEALLEEANKTLLQRKEPPDDLPNDRRIVQIPQRSVSVATDDRERLTNDALTLDLPLKHPSVSLYNFIALLNLSNKDIPMIKLFVMLCVYRLSTV